MAFQKATKQNATIKLALTGPSGSGKTYSALLIAKGLGGNTALLDTEFGSASLYSDIFEFDTWDEQDPNGFPPEYYIRVIKAAEAAGYQNLIIDSLSHEWSGRGGCLEIADALGKTKFRGNSYVAWGEVTPRHNKLIEAIVGARINIIATMRAKTEYALNKDEKTGKTTPQKLGLGAVQRDGMDYEFTTMFELDRDSHIANAGKDRTSLFRDPFLITEETGKRLADWLTKPAPKEKRDPRQYVYECRDKALANGGDLTELCNAYSTWLQLPSPIPPEEMTDEQIRQLAIKLYKAQQ